MYVTNDVLVHCGKVRMPRTRPKMRFPRLRPLQPIPFLQPPTPSTSTHTNAEDDVHSLGV